MKRKLIQQGGGGLTVYLPKKWVDSQELKPGDEVEIEVDDTFLKISGSIQKKRKEISFDIKGDFIKNLRYLLRQLYRQGNERIILKYTSDKQYTLIEEMVEKEYIGLEIVDKKEGQCIIESLVALDEEKYKLFLRKIFQLINQTVEVIEQSGDPKEIEKYTSKVRGYQNFGKMVVANLRKGLIDYEHYSLLSYLINIQADLNKMVVEMCKRKLKISKGGRNQLMVLKDIFKQIERAFFTDDLNSLLDLNKRTYKYKDKILAKFQRIDKKDFIFHHYFMETLRFVYGSMSPMMGIVINRTKNL